ncbi:MAG: hypothetical protein V3R89_09250 [Thermoanaerobaculia bacterium]
MNRAPRQTLLAACLAFGAVSCQKATQPESAAESRHSEPLQEATGPPSAEASSRFLGSPGLPVEITIGQDDWTALRDPARVEEFREPPREFTIRFGRGRALPASYRDPCRKSRSKFVTFRTCANCAGYVP